MDKNIGVNDMDLGLCGKTVFITASSGGIGKAVAEGFLREGASVIVNGRKESRLESVLLELRSRYGEEREAAIKDAADRIKDYVPHIDIAVGNLGTGKPVTEDKFDLKEWRCMLDMNLLSAVSLIRNTRNLFSENGGSIIVMASLAAHDRIGAPPAYAASKAGLVSLVKYAAPILIKQNIRINAVSPGNVFFEGGRWEEIMRQDPANTKIYLKTEVPMQRFGAPEEIAEAVLFLGSEKSGFMTGTVVQIDGGQGKGY